MRLFRCCFVSALLMAPVTPAADQPARLPHDKPVYAVVFTPDGKTLLSAGGDGQVRLWDVASRREVRRWPAHLGGTLALVLTADGKTLATGGRDSHVRLWDAATGKEKGQLAGVRGDVEGLALSGDGKVLAATGSGRTGTFRTPTDGLLDYG